MLITDLKKDVLLDILAEARLIRKRNRRTAGALRFGLLSGLIEKKMRDKKERMGGGIEKADREHEKKRE